MTNLRFLLIFLLIPFFGIAQSINGVYTGVLSNDSTTVRKDQSFEMALTEYKGKVYGYAYSTFIVNDTLYYIVKRVKGTIEGDVCEVGDDEVVSHNFPQKPERKVFVTYTLRRNGNDSTWRLDGNWKTNLTKKYYAISGKVETKEEKDLAKSKLYEHLGDLNLQNTVVLEKTNATAPEKKTEKPKDIKADVAKNTSKKEGTKNQLDKKADEKVTANPVVKTETVIPVASEQKDIAATKTEETANENAVIIPEVKQPDKKTESVVSNNSPKQNDKKNITSTNSAPDVKPDNKSAAVTTNNQSIPNEKKDVVVNNQNTVDKKQETSVVKQETKLPDSKPVVAANNQPNQNEKKNVTVATNPNNNNTTTTTTQPEKKLVSVPPGTLPNQNANNNTTTTSEKKLVSVPVGSRPTQNANNSVAVSTSEKKPESTTNQNQPESKSAQNVEFQELKRTTRRLKPAAELVDKRVSVPSETIFFKSDSLSIALYDNGEVDGDTVSVIINDVMFIEKQGLKSSAFRKTFYVPENESDSLLVVLYAENLGKYPPNTGLLQIKDGEEIFYVRFKADLDRNAAIVLRRKTKK